MKEVSGVYTFPFSDTDDLKMALRMKSDPRLNWHFESSSRYSGLSRCVPSSSHLTSQIISSWIGPIRLVADEFVLSTPQIVSSWSNLSPPSSSRRLITHHSPSALVKCRVRLVELWGRLVVNQFHLQISKKYRSWEGPRTWFPCKMAAVDNRERSLDDLKASLRDGVQHLIARLIEEIWDKAKNKDRPAWTPNVVFVVASHCQNLQIIVLL